MTPTDETIQKRAAELAKELMMYPLNPQVGDDCPQHFYEMLEITFAKHIAGKLSAEYENGRVAGIDEAVKCCTIGPYFKAPNIGKNLLDAVAKSIRLLKQPAKDKTND